MKTVTISSKYQVVIPSVVRAKLNVGSGDKLVIESISDTQVVLKKEPTYQDFLGIAQPSKTDAVERIKKLRGEWRGES